MLDKFREKRQCVGRFSGKYLHCYALRAVLHSAIIIGKNPQTYKQESGIHRTERQFFVSKELGLDTTNTRQRSPLCELSPPTSPLLCYDRNVNFARTKSFHAYSQPATMKALLMPTLAVTCAISSEPSPKSHKSFFAPARRVSLLRKTTGRSLTAYSQPN
jgi:hypothetical protein